MQADEFTNYIITMAARKVQFSTLAMYTYNLAQKNMVYIGCSNTAIGRDSYFAPKNVDGLAQSGFICKVSDLKTPATETMQAQEPRSIMLYNFQTMTTMLFTDKSTNPKQETLAQPAIEFLVQKMQDAKINPAYIPV